MKVFVVLSVVIVCALSQVVYPRVYSPYRSYPYQGIPYTSGLYRGIIPPVPVAAPVIVPTSSQYHAQDILGQYTFGSSEPGQARVETKTLDGTVTGAYSYVDPTGKLINVNYLADHNGFRVLGANNLPVAPEAPVVGELEPVKETPEVEAARTEFEMKFAKAKAAGGEVISENLSRKKRQILYSTPLIGTTAPLLAKSTLKYKTFEPVDAMVPADTKKIELVDKETEITRAVAPLPVVRSFYNPYYGLRSAYFL